MKSAKEMFEKLGYEVQYISKNQVVYKQKHSFGDSKQIIINDLPQTNRGFYVNYSVENQGGYISFGELQAINKQVEELGWLDVKD